VIYNNWNVQRLIISYWKPQEIQEYQPNIVFTDCKTNSFNSLRLKTSLNVFPYHLVGKLPATSIYCLWQWECWKIQKWVKKCVCKAISALNPNQLQVITNRPQTNVIMERVHTIAYCQRYVWLLPSTNCMSYQKHLSNNTVGNIILPLESTRIKLKTKNRALYIVPLKISY
jgi:hypothetical protein